MHPAHQLSKQHQCRPLSLQPLAGRTTLHQAAPPSTQRTHHVVLHQAVQRELGLIVHVNLHGLQNKQRWKGGSGAAAIRGRTWPKAVAVMAERGKQCLHQFRTPGVEGAGVASWWSSASNHTRPLLASSCRC